MNFYVKRSGLATIFLLITLVCNPFSGTISAKEKRIKLATLAPEGSIWLDQMAELNTELKELTQGKVKFKVYPGGIMGDDEVVFRKMRVGQLDGAIFTTGAMGTIDSEFNTLAFPGLFKSYSEVDLFLEQHGDIIHQTMSDRGYKVLGVMGLGFTYMFTQKTIVTPDDLKSAKAWLWDNDRIMKEIYSNIGVTPVSVGISDVMTALQTGLIDTVFNTPTGILSMQWFTRTRRMIDQPLTSAFGVLLVTQKAWKKIPDEQKPIIADLVQKHASEITRKTREKDVQALNVLKERGIIVDQPGDELRQYLDTVCQKSIKNLLSGDINPRLYNMITSDTTVSSSTN